MDIGWYIYIARIVLFVRQIYVAQAGLFQISAVKDDLEFLISPSSSSPGMGWQTCTTKSKLLETFFFS